MAICHCRRSGVVGKLALGKLARDNCTETQSNMLENLHLEAIRIITGGVRGTSPKKLYEESGFCTLKERRRRHNLLMFKKNATWSLSTIHN